MLSWIWWARPSGSYDSCQHGCRLSLSNCCCSKTNMRLILRSHESLIITQFTLMCWTTHTSTNHTAVRFKHTQTVFLLSAQWFISSLAQKIPLNVHKFLTPGHDLVASSKNLVYFTLLLQTWYQTSVSWSLKLWKLVIISKADGMMWKVIRRRDL